LYLLGWRRHVPPKSRLNFNRLHGVISQKIELLENELISSLNTIIRSRVTRDSRLYVVVLAGSTDSKRAVSLKTVRITGATGLCNSKFVCS
jgi:hypothetical protein